MSSDKKQEKLTWKIGLVNIFRTQQIYFKITLKKNKQKREEIRENRRKPLASTSQLMECLS